MAEDDANEEQSDADSGHVDASYRVSEGTLSEEEQDFARTMGFGDDGNDGADDQEDVCDSAPADVIQAVVDESESVDAAESGEAADPPSIVDGDDESEAEAVSAEEDGLAASDGANDDTEDEVATESPDSGLDEIHSRASADTYQETIEARAESLLDETEDAAQGSSASGDSSLRLAELEAELVRRAMELQDSRSALDAALADQKPEAFHDETDVLVEERDQLVDRLAVTSGELAHARGQIEELTASVKAARAAVVPLPEGERALRAEVLGLRNRLEESAKSAATLTERRNDLETELAISVARVDDRQFDIAAAVEEAGDLRGQLVEREAELESLRGRNREAMTLAGRLQSENAELRSTQVALEETIEARDLEISAKEEHLAVTREGLAARDLRVLETHEQLDAVDRRADALSGESARQAIEIQKLEQALARREARIAALTQTVSSVESALGQRRESVAHAADGEASASSDPS